MHVSDLLASICTRIKNLSLHYIPTHLIVMHAVLNVFCSCSCVNNLSVHYTCTHTISLTWGSRNGGKSETIIKLFVYNYAYSPCSSCSHRCCSIETKAVQPCSLLRSYNQQFLFNGHPTVDEGILNGETR